MFPLSDHLENCQLQHDDDFESHLEDIILARCWTKDAKTEEKGAQLPTEESEILRSENVEECWRKRRNDGELT